jgi:hypothetical protein
MKTLSLAVGSLALAAAFAATASDPVTDAMMDAYAPYRAALFRTNSKAQAESEQTLAEARKRWQAFADRYGARPSAPYDRDPAFASTLADVAKVYQTASTQIGAGKLTEAHETLEEARELMAQLRRRNGVIIYSDHMNAYHAQMEHVLIDGGKLLDQPGGILQLMAQVGVLEFLGEKLKAEAPKDVAASAEFPAMVRGVHGSVAALKKAVLAQDQAQIKDAIGKLKSPYSKLFLNYG